MQVTSRTQWKARAARPMTDGNHPTECFIHHSDDPNGDYATVAARKAHIRGIQDFHMDGRGWSDIAYHFLVFQVPDGGVFQGRLARYVPAAQLSHNTGTLAICVVGDGDHEAMAPHTRFYIEQIVKQYPGVKTIGGHRDVVATDCPGDKFYASIAQIARASGRKVYKTSRG